MSKLKSVLEAALPDVTSLGGGCNVDRDRLVDLLRQLTNDLSFAYRLRSGLAGIVLIIILAIIGRYGDQPAILAGAASGMAITLAGALAALQQVIDEMARVKMILSIAAELTLE